LARTTPQRRPRPVDGRARKRAVASGGASLRCIRAAEEACAGWAPPAPPLDCDEAEEEVTDAAAAGRHAHRAAMVAELVVVLTLVVNPG